MEDSSSNLISNTNELPRGFLEQVWQQRANRLARVPDEEHSGEQIELLLFRLGSEHYAIEAECVYEIRLRGEITSMPRVPDWLLGLSSMRGKIITVIDLCRFFRLPPRSLSDQDQDSGFQVLVKDGDTEVALFVDEVLSIESISKRTIRQDSSFIPNIPPEQIYGTFQFEESHCVTIIRLPALLADPRLMIEEQI